MTETALVTGATGYTGRHLLARLVQTGANVTALVRSTSDRSVIPERVQIVDGDLEDPASLARALTGIQTVYHIAHVSLTPTLLQIMTETVRNVVIVSSLRALSRVPSETVTAVLQGEAAVEKLRRTSAPAWTILRPSMIFGGGDDRNISRLVGRVRHGRWIPLAGPTRLHQPVFVEDVVDVILACPKTPAAAGKTYAISGAAALSWSELVHTVGEVVGVRPRTLPVPAALGALVMSAVESVGIRPPIRAEQLLRMLEDKIYDIEPARRELGFTPLNFRQALFRIYGEVEENQ